MRASRVAAVVAVAALAGLAGLRALRTPPVTEAPPPPRIDADGDALPAWAMLRLTRARFGAAAAALAFSKDGAAILHGTPDGFVRTIDAATGAVLREFPAETAATERPPPRSLMSALRRRVALLDLERVPNRLQFASFSADASRVVTRSANAAHVYDTATGARISAWNQDDWGPVALDAAGVTGLFGDHEGRIVVRDAATGRRLRENGSAKYEPRGYGGPPRLAASAKHAALQAARLRVVELATGETAFETEPGEHAGPVAFSADGSLLAHTSGGTSLVVRETGAFGMVAEVRCAAQALAISPDGRFVAAAERERLRVLSLADGKETASFDVVAHELTFSPDGRRVAALETPRIRVFDLARGAEATPAAGVVSQPSWSPDGARIAVAHAGQVRVFDAATGALVRSRDTGAEWAYLERFVLDGRTVIVRRRSAGDAPAAIGTVDLDGDAPPAWMDLPKTAWARWNAPIGNWTVALQDEAGATQILDAAGRPIADAKFECVLAVDSALGLLVTRGTTDRRFDVRSFTDGRLVCEIALPLEMKIWPTIDVEGPFIVMHVDEGGHVSLHDAATGTRIALVATGLEIDAVDVTRDGALLAVSDADGSIHLVATDDGRPRRVLRGHRGRVHGLSFSPDGRRLTSFGADGAVFVWDAAVR